MISSILAAGGLVTLAMMHSFLGERMILVPLLAEPWSITLPRPAAERILRFAWHLTSLAWLGLAAAVAGAEAAVTVGVVCLVSAVIVVAASRTHPAWPVFLIAGLAALDRGGVLPSGFGTAAGLGAATVLVAASGLHWYWVLGGRWLLDRAVPARPVEAGDEPVDESSPLRPGRLMTAAVAVMLLVLAGAVGAATIGVGGTVVHLMGWSGVVAFGLRAVGDGRLVGFTKSVRSTRFARADDAVFTPMVVVIALAAAGGLLAG